MDGGRFESHPGQLSVVCLGCMPFIVSSLSGLKGGSWKLSGVVGPTELEKSGERLREKMEYGEGC